MGLYVFFAVLGIMGMLSSLYIFIDYSRSALWYLVAVAALAMFIVGLVGINRHNESEFKKSCAEAGGFVKHIGQRGSNNLCIVDGRIVK